jgi:hypothetical protein
MHHRLELPFVFRPQRDHKAAFPLGDDWLLQHGSELGIGHQALQPGFQPVARQPQLAPHLGQPGRGAIQHLGPIADGPGDGGHDFRGREQPLGDGFQLGEGLFQLLEAAAQIPRREQGVLDLEQVARLQHRAAGGGNDPRAHVASAADRELRPQFEQAPRLARFGLASPGLRQIGGGAQRERLVAGGGEGRSCCQPSKHLGQLEGLQVLRVHDAAV